MKSISCVLEELQTDVKRKGKFSWFMKRGETLFICCRDAACWMLKCDLKNPLLCTACFTCVYIGAAEPFSSLVNLALILTDI